MSRLRDVCCNEPSQAHHDTARWEFDAANSFGAISGTTDANGVFKTTLASTLAQNDTITATERTQF
jgi:hypothetical protein